MAFLMVALLIALILWIVLNPKRWNGLGQGARAFGKRFAGQVDSRKGRGPVRQALQQGDEKQARVILDSEMWTYRNPAFVAIDLDGFKVHATDGAIGTVDTASNEGRSSYLIVKRSIGRKKTMLPASAVMDIDPDSRSLWIDRSQEEVESAPAFDLDTYRSAAYRSALAKHYELR